MAWDSKRSHEVAYIVMNNGIRKVVQFVHANNPNRINVYPDITTIAYYIVVNGKPLIQKMVEYKLAP